jgi:dTDP-glucose pyrophosphorylase
MFHGLQTNLAGTLPESIADLLGAINRSGRGFYVALGRGGEIEGLVTDGDVRRALLDGISLSDSPLTILNVNPVVVGPEASKPERQATMRISGVRQLLIVDQQNRFLDFDILTSAGVEKENWVIIMAGGLGTRMHPHTLEVPKPMLRVHGQPILDHIISMLADQGFRNFAISVNYLAGQIEDYFQDGSSRGLRIEYLREPELLGTAGALGLFSVMTSESVVVVNGDVLTDADFGEMIRSHESSGSICTIGLKQVQFQNPFGVVETEGASVVNYVEKPVLTSLISAGIYIFSPTALRRLDGKKRLDMPDLIRSLISEGSGIHAFPLVGSWFDVGRPADFYAAGGDR